LSIVAHDILLLLHYFKAQCSALAQTNFAGNKLFHQAENIDRSWILFRSNYAVQGIPRNPFHFEFRRQQRQVIKDSKITVDETDG
jgi:hypothetical protein